MVKLYATQLIRLSGVAKYTPRILMSKLHFSEFHSAMITVPTALCLMNTALHVANSHDFKVQVFAPLAINYVLYYIEARKWRRTVVASMMTPTI